MRYVALLGWQSFFCGCLLLFFLLPSLAHALSADLEVETILRSFERDVPLEGSSNVLPGYGYLKFDVKNISQANLSFHGYGWGRYDAADSKFYDSRSKGELLYGYVEYHRQFSTLRARVGRMHIFEGVANETLDGFWAAGNLTAKISASGYAGQPVGLSSTNGRSSDTLFGGRIAYAGNDNFELGGSAKFSNNDGNSADSMLGVDLIYYLPKEMSLFGYSKFNTDQSGFAEHSWELRIPFETIEIKPYLQYYAYDSYFGTGAKAKLPFRNLAKSGESLGIYGVDTFWRKSEEWNFGTKFKYYSYDQNESSEYLGLAVNFLGEERTQSGGELGYMKGDAANNNYLLLRLFTYQDRLPKQYWAAFLSGDLVYALYDKSINGKDSSLFLSLGVGKHFWNDALDLKLSADYSSDPFYSSDFRGTLSATVYFGRGL
ncbi:MAG: hypothetical protein L3J63_05180 [Geopsychrobacter sp.]|nr:hypothetical protein [Geopsychrobacter sp.]